jgi:hypothetical protein
MVTHAPADMEAARARLLALDREMFAGSGLAIVDREKTW